MDCQILGFESNINAKVHSIILNILKFGIFVLFDSVTNVLHYWKTL